MEDKQGRLVKAYYDFPTDDASELPLLVGDIIQVTERIDKQWSRGVCANREGNFPIRFTVDIKHPQLSDHQQLFAVTNDFIAQENGDLTLKKGDLVIGNTFIDENWWSGEKDGLKGIFPITHVWKINKSILPVIVLNRKMFSKARVKMNMTAQLSEEMNLIKDEIVNIYEEVEKGWYRGECNGQCGIFPASFVTLLPDSASDNCSLLPENSSATCVENSSTTLEMYDNKYGYDCINSGITSYGRVLYPFKAEHEDELTLKGDEIVNLIRHVDKNWIEGEIDGKTGIFPTSFINIIVDCPKSDKLSKNSKIPETDVSLFPPDTYGRVTCDFTSHLEGDVKLKEGDTVTLIRKIDQNYYEVETDNGDAGICPESFIEVIGSGPPSYSEVMASNGSYNTSLIDADLSFSDNSRSASKMSRPLSFASSASDSSFSSQNSANEKSSRELHQNLEDKSAENLSTLNSSLMFPESFSDKSSNVTYSNIDGSTSYNKDLLSSTYNSSHVHFAPNSSPFSVSSNVNRAESNIASNLGESDIKNQIHLKEQTLKQRIGCLNKLENELKNTSNSSVASEIRIQISQLNEDIDRLRKEIDSLNAKLKPDHCSASAELNSNAEAERKLRDEEVARKRELEQKRREQEKINKMKEQRECIITELLQTEKDYVSDLKLLHDTFMANPDEAKNKGINVMALFGNLDEVINVADRLLKRLRKVSSNNQLIGECFVDMSDEMKEIYGHYCRNHDEATSVLDKIDSQSPAGQFINLKLEILKRQTNCFDLGAMLIKPVQRILKYPLLLDQLLKSTEDSHPDKAGLKQAIGIMSDVATAINEFKRQKDLG